MAQDRGQWRALVNTEVNLRFPLIGGEFLDQLCDYQFLKKDFAPWSNMRSYTSNSSAMFTIMPRSVEVNFQAL
jgi:hypothetical protein